jgi:hypothetical protein
MLKAAVAAQGDVIYKETADYAGWSLHDESQVLAEWERKQAIGIAPKLGCTVIAASPFGFNEVAEP